jgi:hypothetical protein
MHRPVRWGAKHAQYLCWFSSYLVDVRRLSQPCFKGHPKIPMVLRLTVLVLREAGLARAFGRICPIPQSVLRWVSTYLTRSNERRVCCHGLCRLRKAAVVGGREHVGHIRTEQHQEHVTDTKDVWSGRQWRYEGKVFSR